MAAGPQIELMLHVVYHRRPCALANRFTTGFAFSERTVRSPGRV